MSEDQEFEQFPIRNAVDNAILMHREAHFGGNFEVMLDYYEKGGKGVFQEFDVEQIRQMAQTEEATKQNLAPLLLTGPEAETVARAKKAYQQLRDLYEDESLPGKYPLLIADLVLAEEEHPEAEIEAIVKEQGAIVPSLLTLVRAEDFYDPLFPGYGWGPILAAECLGRIGDKRAILALFEGIGMGDMFNEDVLLLALRAIGQPAIDFLLKVVQSRPLNDDNVRAAVALLAFKDNQEIAETCCRLLLEPEVRSHVPLATYLALACEGLTNPDLQTRFRGLASDPATPEALVLDMKVIVKSWAAAP